MTGRRDSSKPPTIYDVAQHAGVSISTVSLALNSPKRVSPVTRERVYASAAALGFVPKAEATARARRGSGRIGVLAPFSSYPSFHARLDGILRATDRSDIDVVVYDHESVAATDSPLLTTIPIQRPVDGLIVMGIPLDPDNTPDVDENTLPIVLVDTVHPSYDSVTMDDVAGGALVAKHLLARKHQRFAFVGEIQRSHRYASPSEQRLTGYSTYLANHGHTVPPEHVAVAPHDVEAAQPAITELLERIDPPCAVFAHDDVLAAATWKAARQHGLDLPNDVAIVGFDDSELARALDLTSVRAPFEESGQGAVGLLLERIASPDRPVRHTHLQQRLIIRSSTTP